MFRTIVSTAALVAASIGLAVAPASAAAVPIQHPGYSACAYEDSPGPCFWDAGSFGNHQGHSFYVTRDQRVVYGTLKWRVLAAKGDRALPDAHRCQHDLGSRGDATTCLTVGPWHRVSRSYADVLAEGAAHDRDWQSRCFWHHSPTARSERLLACVGGFRELR